MNNWISKAANVFQRDVKETPQLFEVQCECGQSHRGVRRSRHQHIVCKDCGVSLFVLPRDTYPPPQERKGKKKKPVQPVISTPVGMGMDEDIPEQAEISPHDAMLDEVVVLEKTAPRHRNRKQQAPVPEPSKKKSKQKTEPAPPPTPGFFQRFGAGVKEMAVDFVKFWTPFRAAMLGISLLMSFAVYWSIQESRRTRAAASVKQFTEEGLQAVKEEDWIAARRAFEQATNAVDVLDRQDSEAENIRRYYFETRAITDLSGVDLFNLLNEAEASYNAGGAEQWEADFLYHQEDWIAMTGPVELVDGSPSTSKDEVSTDGYQLYFPWGPGKSPKTVRVLVDFMDFESLVPSQGRHNVTFAGELASCSYSDATKTWTVTFKPESGFVWCHPETYTALNFETNSLETEEELLARLKKQAEAVGAGQ